jgi:hypothetical protein
MEGGSAEAVDEHDGLPGALLDVVNPAAAPRPEVVPVRFERQNLQPCTHDRRNRTSDDPELLSSDRTRESHSSGSRPCAEPAAEAGEVAIEQETASAIPALVTSSLLCIIRNLPPANGRATRIDQPRDNHNGTESRVAWAWQRRGHAPLRPTCGEPAPRRRPEPPAVRRAATDATDIGGGAGRRARLLETVALERGTGPREAKVFVGLRSGGSCGAP